MTELITGQATEAANNDAATFFSGTISPRQYRVDESLINRGHDTLEALFQGRLSNAQVAEAFSTSDTALGIFAAIDTRVIGEYEALPSVWRQYTTVTEVPDFRPVRLLDRWSDTFGLKRVPELTEYPQVSGEGHKFDYITVAKNGLRDAWSWESQLNGTLPRDVKDAPGKYTRAADETEAINALSNLLTVDPKTNLASGINANFFKAGNGNAIDNRQLTAENLDAVLDELGQKTPKGKLVATPDFIVVIPKALERQMQRILALREIRTVTGDTTSVYDNFLTTVDYVVEPMLDVVNTAGTAKTSWFVLPKPGGRRPALYAAFLTGHEVPDMRYRVDAGQRLGGGLISPLEGSFDIDAIQTRVRHIVGNQTGDPTFTYASTGA